MIDLSRLEIVGPVSCYNGCYDSKTQRALDAQEEVLKAIKTKEPEAHITYFPLEQQFQVHAWGRPLSGFFSTRAAAISDAYTKLFQENLQ